MKNRFTFLGTVGPALVVKVHFEDVQGQRRPKVGGKE